MWVSRYSPVRPTVAAFDVARFYTNDRADNYRPAIGTESIRVIAGSQHIAQRNVSVDVLLSGCHVPVLLAVQRLNPDDLCSSGQSAGVIDVLCASKGTPVIPTAKNATNKYSLAGMPGSIEPVESRARNREPTALKVAVCSCGR